MPCRHATILRARRRSASAASCLTTPCPSSRRARSRRCVDGGVAGGTSCAAATVQSVVVVLGSAWSWPFLQCSPSCAPSSLSLPARRRWRRQLQQAGRFGPSLGVIQALNTSTPRPPVQALIDFENVLALEPKNFLGDDFSRVTQVLRVLATSPCMPAAACLPQLAGAVAGLLPRLDPTSPRPSPPPPFTTTTTTPPPRHPDTSTSPHPTPPIRSTVSPSTTSPAATPCWRAQTAGWRRSMPRWPLVREPTPAGLPARPPARVPARLNILLWAFVRRCVRDVAPCVLKPPLHPHTQPPSHPPTQPPTHRLQVLRTMPRCAPTPTSPSCARAPSSPLSSTGKAGCEYRRLTGRWRFSGRSVRQIWLPLRLPVLLPVLLTLPPLLLLPQPQPQLLTARARAPPPPPPPALPLQLRRTDH